MSKIWKSISSWGMFDVADNEVKHYATSYQSISHWGLFEV